MKKIIVVDLDGTLSNNNTFHMFVRFIFLESLKKLNFIWSVRILFWTSLRSVKLINHKKWKFEILKCVNNKHIRLEFFVENVHQTINQFILDEMKDYDFKILATAAPELYSQKISEYYNFTHLTATKFTKNHECFDENIQSIKFENVKKILCDLSTNTIDLLITDHIDDAKLINYAKKTWLINANAELKKFIDEEKLNEQVKYINLK